MIEIFKKVLVLAPHTDDGELGAGGTISKLVEMGVEVFYAAFSTAEESVPEGFPKDILTQEVKAATAQLGIPSEQLFIYHFKVRKLNYARQDILEEMVALRKKHAFDLILIPSLTDVHQDHQTVAQEAVRAFKHTSIFCYELIWNNLQFNNQCFVLLDDRHIEAKVRALKEYKSQNFRDYTSEEFIRSLAKVRGVQVSAQWAECFEIIRLFLK